MLALRVMAAPPVGAVTNLPPKPILRPVDAGGGLALSRVEDAAACVLSAADTAITRGRSYGEAGTDVGGV